MEITISAWKYVRVYAAQSGGAEIVPHYGDIGTMLESGTPNFPGMPNSNLPTCPAWHAIVALRERGVRSKYVDVLVTVDRRGNLHLPRA